MANFVFVHGAFTGGWVWSRVRPWLTAAGHSVWTPTLTGSGERSHLLSRSVSLRLHIEDIVQVLRYEDLRDVVLVGHSYGGMVITGVADRVPDRLARLVYLDAAYPADGQNAAGGFSDGTDDALEAMSSAGPDEANWLLPPLPLAAYGVTEPADVAWVGDRRVAHPLITLQEPLSLQRPAGAGLPRVYVRHTRREGLVQLFGSDPLLPMFERAIADGCAVLEVDAGHDAMISAPQAVAEALLTAVRAAPTGAA